MKNRMAAALFVMLTASLAFASEPAAATFEKMKQFTDLPIR